MPFSSLLVKEQQNIQGQIALYAIPLASESLPWMSVIPLVTTCPPRAEPRITTINDVGLWLSS
jgi:hypothetical protein